MLNRNDTKLNTHVKQYEIYILTRKIKQIQDNVSVSCARHQQKDDGPQLFEIQCNDDAGNTNTTDKAQAMSIHITTMLRTIQLTVMTSVVDSRTPFY